MRRSEVVSALVSRRLMAIVRLPHAHDLIGLVQALQSGGVDVLEFSMTTPDALGSLAAAVGRFQGDVLLGAGTVLDAATACAAITAGARFIVSPTLNGEVIETAHRYGVAVIPGAMSPTEVLRACELGSDLVKVFPADILGPDYVRALAGPLAQARLVAVGGIHLGNVQAFLRAGAVAVGAGSSLVKEDDVIFERYEEVAARARAWVAAVSDATGAAVQGGGP